MPRLIAVTAHYDTESGELTSFRLTSALASEDALLRADVLQDLLAQAQAAYDAAHDEALRGLAVRAAAEARP